MEIPKIPWDHADANTFIASGKPVVLLGCPLSTPAADRWSPDFLSTVIDSSFRNTAFKSNSLKFQYWDDKKNSGYNYISPVEKEELTFNNFLSKLRSTSSEEHYYLQQAVVAEMGPSMMAEYTKFSLEAAVKFKLTGKWDQFSTNLLLVGKAGAVTPCHFDEQGR